MTQRRVYTTIPASDLDRARRWYEEKLGMKPSLVDATGATYSAGEGTGFLLYPTPNAGKAPATLMSFSSKDVRADVGILRKRGVVFEEYDFPGLKTDDGVARLGAREAAWFRDSEGNILALGSE